MMTKRPLNSVLRIAAILVLLTGATLSAILTLSAGRKNASIILPALFFIWVLSPFIILLFAGHRFKRSIRNIHCLFVILLSILSVIAYTGALNPVNAKAAAVFLFTPLISWILIIIVVVVSKKSKSG